MYIRARWRRVCMFLCVWRNTPALVKQKDRNFAANSSDLRPDSNRTINNTRKQNQVPFFMMELRIIFPVLSMLSSAVFHSVALPAPRTEGAAAPARTKRCSCATFLDKECVYFCHLDIIWVNTPERTVSYGLGNAPRRRRSVARASRDPARCRCLDSSDSACASFCHTDYPLRYKAAPDKVIPTACGHDCAEKQCKHDVAAQTQSKKRTGRSVGPSVAIGQVHLLLEKWRLRRIQKAWAWAAENAAS